MRQNSIKGVIYTVLITAVLLVMSNIAIGHEDEPHPQADSNLVVTDEVLSDSASLLMDSIYSLIQEDYQNLQPLLKRACYDCHSNQTDYPWYYKLPLVKGLIDADITEAIKHLDLSKGFPFAGHGKPVQDLEAIKKALEEGDMPPFKYKMLHWGASLSTEETDSVTTWIDSSLALITRHHLTVAGSNPGDSIQGQDNHEE